VVILATVGEIYEFLNEKAPFALQQSYDNAGFLLGREGAEVSKVLVALDITKEVIEEAKSRNADLIVSHHPLIWGKLSSVTDQNPTGEKLLELIESNIAAICAHTNLDAVEGGVNSALAQRLQLEHPVPLQEEGQDSNGLPFGIGRVGTRLGGPICLEAFAKEVKASLDLEGIRVLDAGRPVHKVAVGGGACGSMLQEVIKKGCDTFVTSELKHDVFLEAKAHGVNLLDAGHFSTEAVVLPILAAWLQEGFPTLTAEIATTQGEAYTYR
jgi:dinuclear metal center YbgI/SA1388 family protein